MQSNQPALSSAVAERARKFFGQELHTSQERAISGSLDTWLSVLRRCFNPLDKGYRNYGGRGITVCERWFSFANFLADMGPRPEGLTLERQDNDGGYEPDNCVWATQHAQSRNKRTTKKSSVNGIESVHVDLAKQAGVSPATISRRHKQGLVGNQLAAAPYTKRMKLNQSQVAEIRTLLATDATRAAIAKQFGVSVQMIGSIDRGEAWRPK